LSRRADDGPASPIYYKPIASQVRTVSARSARDSSPKPVPTFSQRAARATKRRDVQQLSELSNPAIPSIPSLQRRCSAISVQTTKNPVSGDFVSPLTDSNRRPPPYHGGFGLSTTCRRVALIERFRPQIQSFSREAVPAQAPRREWRYGWSGSGASAANLAGAVGLALARRWTECVVRSMIPLSGARSPNRRGDVAVYGRRGLDATAA
jgi:hypothetical protein